MNLGLQNTLHVELWLTLSSTWWLPRHVADLYWPRGPPLCQCLQDSSDAGSFLVASELSFLPRYPGQRAHCSLLITTWIFHGNHKPHIAQCGHKDPSFCPPVSPSKLQLFKCQKGRIWDRFLEEAVLNIKDEEMLVRKNPQNVIGPVHRSGVWQRTSSWVMDEWPR